MFVNAQSLNVMMLAAVVFSSGCGGASDAPTLYRVSGIVTYKGQNVPGAKVMFMGDGTKPPAVGITNEDGKYSLSSLAGTGAVAGRHVVAVIKESEPDPTEKVNMSMEEAAAAAQKPEKSSKPTSLIPAKYADPQTSGLEFEVTSGTNDFPIDLKD
ncbi:MAG: carboxypeptidase-like regulatory domain-containing protein [Planctomycetaceae bacterium]